MSLNSAASTETREVARNIDPKVIELLEAEDEIPVIIMLKDEPMAKKSGIFTKPRKPAQKFTNAKEKRELMLAERKPMIKKQQDKVLFTLDFEQLGNDMGNIRVTGVKGKEVKTNLKGNKKDFGLKRKFTTLNGFHGMLTKQGLEKLKNNPNVKSISYDEILHISLDSSVPLINTSNAWATQVSGTNITGAGQTVCVIDTGAAYNHTSLGGCTSVEFLAGNCSTILSGYDYLNSDTDPLDDHGHGTHITGIIISNDSTYKGVAPDAKIVSLKACGSDGSCSTSAITNSVDWCINNASTFNISVISMSLGTDTRYSSACDTQTLASSANSAAAAGLFVVAATGNDNDEDGISSPACGSNVTSIGSTTKADAVSESFSNSASILDLLAPGSSIKSLKAAGTGAGTCVDAGVYRTCSGTSMATPHVAGAATLLYQYYEAITNTTLTWQEIKTAFNSTGENINDSRNGIIRPRIDVYSALLTLAPTITFVDPTPANNTIITNAYTMINITSPVNLNSALLEWNSSTNTTMNGSGTNWYYNQTGTNRITYKVYGNTTGGAIGESETRTLTLNDSAPTIDTKYPNLVNVSIAEPNNQTFNLTYSDPEGNPVHIYWYLNSTQDSTYNNLSHYNFTGNYSATGDYNITVVVSDTVLNGSNSWILTVNNTNRAPTLTILQTTVSINETSVLVLNDSSLYNASDPDGDTTTINATSADFVINQTTLNYTTTYNDVGPHIVTINVTDTGNLSATGNITVNIINIDTDNDGNPDWNETDDDNDGINDTTDYLNGNISLVTTTGISVLNITVNSSTNLSQTFNTTLFTRIYDNTSLIIEFNFSFADGSALDLAATVIEKQNTTNGGLLLKGVNLTKSNTTKTFYILNVSSSHGVCIKDAEINLLSEISTNCTGTNEQFVDCSGARGGYNCTANGTGWKITGLSNSGVVQANDTQSPAISSLSTSVSTSGATISFSVDESSNYSISYGTTTALGTDNSNSTKNSQDKSVSLSGLSSSTKYYYNITTCDAYDNCGTNGTFSFTTSTPTTTSSGGGGGGGGSTVDVSSGKVLPTGLSRSYSTSKKVAVNGKISFSAVGGTHSVKVKKVINATHATIEIASTPQEITLGEGESRIVDLNGDKISDLLVKMISVKATGSTRYAEISLKLLAQPKPKKEVKKVEEKTIEVNASKQEGNKSQNISTPPTTITKEDKKGYTMVLVIIGVIAGITIILLATLRMLKKRKIRKVHHKKGKGLNAEKEHIKEDGRRKDQ